MQDYENLQERLETTINRMGNSPQASQGRRLLQELETANKMVIQHGKHGDYAAKVRTINKFIDANRQELDEDNITDDEDNIMNGGGKRRQIIKKKGNKTRKNKHRGGSYGNKRVMALDPGPKGGPKDAYLPELQKIIQDRHEPHASRARWMILQSPSWFDNNVEEVNEFVQGYYNTRRGGGVRKKKIKKNTKKKTKTKRRHKKNRRFTNKRTKRR